MALTNPRGRRLGFWLACAVVLGLVQQASTPVLAQDADRINVLITFASTPGPADQAAVQAAGGRVRRTFHLVPGMAANIPRQAATALAANPRILAVEPDGQVTAYTFADELNLAWSVGLTGAGSVHADGVTGAGVKVAVVDSGIDYTHPDLASAYAGGYDFVNDDADPLDDNGHGTHVSGTIAAARDGVGVVGMAPGAELYVLKILDAAGNGDWSAVIAATEFMVDNGIPIGNHSYGASQRPPTLVARAFRDSTAAGVLHIAAAGNEGTCLGTGNSIGYPARYAEVVAVGATDLFDVRACYSSTGSALELAAPGDLVVSTYQYPPDSYAYGSGTSMASPHAAGAAALVMSAGVLDPDQVRSILSSTAVDLGEAGWDSLYGFGRIDVAAAVAAAGPVPPAVHVALTTDRTTYDETYTAAVLTAIVTDETGTPILGIASGDFQTTLDDVATSVTFTEVGGGTYTGVLDITSAADGPHVVEVEVSQGALTGSDTASFLVGSTPDPGTLHVPSVAYSGSGGRFQNRNVYITVDVVDGDGAAVASATVTVLVNIDGVPWAFGSGPTDGNGQVIFSAKNAPSGTYTTEVADVQSGGAVWDGVTPPNAYVK